MARDILFLAHRIPYPPDRGDKIRSWHVLRHLAGLGTVHLAAFGDDAADAAHLPALRAALGGRLGETEVVVRGGSRAVAGVRALATGAPVSLTLFDSDALRGFVARMLASGRIGAIYGFSGQMAQFVPDAPGARFVMDFVDMDSAKFAAYASAGNPAMRWVNAREGRRLFAFERQVAARADASLFVSEAEAELFRTRTGLANVHALSNGIDLDAFAPRPFARAPGAAPLLVFTGQMDYAPNVDAVTYFTRDVLPLIPDARFAIVGRSPTPAVRALASSRVTVTGSVPDVQAWIAKADLVVAPLRIARGIQNKVLEAMAMARPVLATPAAFEGIEAEPGRDLVVADGAEALATAARDLIADPDWAARIGHAGRARMEAAYHWDARLAPLAALMFPSRWAAA